MIQKIITLLLLTCMYTFTNGQKIYTKNGHIAFFSKTNMENIKADNNQVMSVLNIQTGELQFSLLQKSFHFDKPLMEEHFNENYIESDKYPKGTFKGAIAEISIVNFNKDGSYNVMVAGDLTLHGVTQKIAAPGKIIISKGKIIANSKFNIKLSSFKIVIPSLVKDNISDNLEITVACDYEQKKN